MTSTPSRRAFPARRALALLAAVALGFCLSSVALAGPPTDDSARREPGDRPAVTMRRQMAASILGTSGLDTFVPLTAPRGYLQTAGPAPMRIRQRAVLPALRRVWRPAPETGLPAALPAASPPPSPTAAPSPAPVPAVIPDAPDASDVPTGPVTNPPEPGLLLETGPSAGENRTQEMLSYFHRSTPRTGNGAPAPGPGTDDPADGAAFLQAPAPLQTPTPAALPPSRATYHVVP